MFTTESKLELNGRGLMIQQKDHDLKIYGQNNYKKTNKRCN